jgi:hypothetical protein
MTEGPYYAKAGCVWKRPIQRHDEVAKVTHITMGFRVCRMMDEVGDEAAETVAALMNAGDAALNKQENA